MQKRMNKFSAGVLLMVVYCFLSVLISSAMPRFCFFLTSKRKSHSAAASRSKALHWGKKKCVRHSN